MVLRYCQNIVLYQYRYGNTQHARCVTFLYFSKSRSFSLDVPLIKVVDEEPLFSHDYTGTLGLTQSRNMAMDSGGCAHCHHFHTSCPGPRGRQGPLYGVRWDHSPREGTPVPSIALGTRTGTQLCPSEAALPPGHCVQIESSCVFSSSQVNITEVRPFPL